MKWTTNIEFNESMVEEGSAFSLGLNKDGDTAILIPNDTRACLKLLRLVGGDPMWWSSIGDVNVDKFMEYVSNTT